MRILSLTLLLFCLTLPGPSAAGAPAALLQEARHRLDRGRADKTYALLAEHEFEYAGDIQFDYLLGVAALDSGRTVAATFALERVVISNPKFAGARLDLGRAYFKLGDHYAAAAEFREVLAVNPPPAIRQVVDEYLAQARRRIDAGGRIFSTRLELALGFDDNINTASSAESVTILGELPISLAQSSRQQEAAYAQINLQSVYLRPLGADWQGFLSGGLKHKQVADFKAYDSSDAMVQAGLQHKQGDRTLALGAQGGRFYLAHDLNYIYHRSYLNWQRNVRHNRAVNLFARHLRVSYTKTRDKTNDFSQVLGGVGGILEKPHYTLWLNGYAGMETALRDTNPDGDRAMVGISASVGLPLRRDLMFRGNLGWQRKHYREINPAFTERRSERYYSAGLELEWLLGASWGLALKYLYTQNDSNLTVYDYDRHNVAVSIFSTF